MEPRDIDGLEYDLELDRVAKEIKKQKAKRILVQLPSGLKPFAAAVTQELKAKIKNSSEIFIWLDSCFGACDVPIEVEKLGVDMIIQFGHSAWDYSKRNEVKVLK